MTPVKGLFDPQRLKDPQAEICWPEGNQAAGQALPMHTHVQQQSPAQNFSTCSEADFSCYLADPVLYCLLRLKALKDGAMVPQSLKTPEDSGLSQI